VGKDLSQLEDFKRYVWIVGQYIGLKEKMVIKHNCPYLEFKKYCTHKHFRNHRIRGRCSFKNIKDCPYLKDSITNLIKIDSTPLKTPKNTISNKFSELNAICKTRMVLR